MNDNLLNPTISAAWARAQEALGGSNLGALLQDLRSEDEEVYGRAWTTLHMGVIGYDCNGPYVQDTAEQVIPFIAALLSYLPMPWKQGLLSILAETDCERFVEYKHLAVRHSPIKFSTQDVHGHEDPVHVAVLAGVEVYLALLNDPDPATRSGAAWLLSVLPEAAGLSRAPLIDMVRTDPDPDVRAAAMDALGRLFGQERAMRGFLIERLHRDEDDLVRLVCAQMLAESAESEAPAETVDILVSALGNPEGVLRRYAEDLPYGQRDALSFISHAVSQLAPQHARAAIPALIASLERVDRYSYWQGECVLQALLHAAFGPSETTPESASGYLTGEQTHVLAALAASDPLWSSVDERDIGDELARYRLPGARAALRERLAAPTDA